MTLYKQILKVISLVEVNCLADCEDQSQCHQFKDKVLWQLLGASNFRLAKIHAIPCLTDRVGKGDAQQAAEWYLDYETS